MKWVLQYFAAPLLAAGFALIGNYYLVQKPLLSKDYTKIGSDILLKDDAPIYLQEYADKLLRMNSPIPVPSDELSAKLDTLFHNVPKGEPSENLSALEALALLKVFLDWFREVEALCPECINQELFHSRYEEAQAELAEINVSRQ